MSFEAAISFFLIVFVFGITPGPGVFAIIARALSEHVRACFPLALGMVVSDILYLIAACFGLALIAQQWTEMFLLIRVLGASYLLYLAWKMWTAPLELKAVTAERRSLNLLWLFLQGFMISASNPKVILFYIAFLPTFLDIQSLQGADIVLVSVLTLVSLMMGLMLLAWLAGSVRGLLEQEHQVRRINRGAGGIMAGAAAFLLLKN